MKKLLSFLVVVLYLGSCTSPDDIINDFQVHITPTFYKYVVEVNVSDLNDPDAAFTANSNVTITGEDAAAIYNIDGTRNYEVNFGTLQLMVEKDVEPTAGDPVRFRVNIEADGFQGVSLPIEIEEGNYFVGADAAMLNLNNLPNSISNTQATKGIDPNTNTLSEPLVVNTGSADSTSRIKLVIPTDVKFLDENGNEIVAKNHGGQLNVSVMSFSDTAQSAQQAMPNGTGAAQPMVVDGQEENVFMEAASTFQINMDIGGVPVRSFGGGKTSGGVAARIPIPSYMYNAEFGRPYEEGDSISMTSFSNGSNAWDDDGRIFIVKKDQSTNELYAEPTIQHLSWWRWWYCWHWWRWFRPTPNRYAFTGHLKDAAGGAVINGYLLYRARVRRSWYSYNTYMWVGGSFGQRLSFRNPRRYWSSYTNSLSNVSLIWDNFGSSFDKTVQTYNQGSRQFYDTEIAPKAQPPVIGYRLICEGSNTIVDPPAGVKMYYKKHNTADPYRHLYTFTNDNLNVKVAAMPKLENNTRYDFRAQFGQEQVDTTNILIIDGTIYDVILPQAACSQLGL